MHASSVASCWQGTKYQGCTLGHERLGLEMVLRHFLNVSVPSSSRDSNILAASQSRHTSHLHRTSKFILKTKKSLFFRDT